MRRKLELAAWIVLGVVAVLGMSVDQRELRFVDTIALVLMLLFIGVRLYRIRLRNRALYGAIEAAVAIGTLIFVIVKGRSPIASAVGNEWQNYFAIYLGLLGGLYIFVRGLDNIDQGLAPIGLLRRTWNVIVRDELAASQSPAPATATCPRC